MTKHKRKILWGILAAIALLLAVLAAGAWSMFGNLITAANSIEKLEDGLYAMEY